MHQPGHDDAGQPQRVASYLAEAARLLGAPEAVALGALQRHWEEVVGPQAALHTRPVHLANAILSISADHPAWAREMDLLSSAVVKRVQEVVGLTVQAVSLQVSRSDGREW